MAATRTRHVISRARTGAYARARRGAVRVLMRASHVPIVRPFARLGMRVLFDSMAGDWEQIRRDPTYRAGFDDALSRLPRGFLPRRALDVACGTGIACRFLLDRWPELDVTGCDIAPKMVHAARDLVPDASFDVASVHELPYGDGEFDLVTVLDGLLDPPELLRVLHPSGRLMIVYSRSGTTPVSRSLDQVSELFAELGTRCTPFTDGPAHVLEVTRRTT